MIFATYWFLLALVCFYSIYISLPARFRLVFLLAFSLIFHGHFAGAAGMAPIVALAVVVYIIGLSGKRALCHAGVTICVLTLLYFKYLLFFAETLTPFAGSGIAQWQDQIAATLPATPPLAISFFVFEFIHYLLDVGRGRPVIKSFFDFLHFTFFFPTLVAGPVKRYESFLPALKSGVGQLSSIDMAIGLLQVMLGAFKKLVLADNISSFIDWSHGQFQFLNLGERWAFVLLLAWRIYFDFSGYSDIAIGIARMLGIRLPANFNFPYRANNITDFWRRWHISLSTWIRDYIYIPLGGSQGGALRKILNGLLAFVLCGLWHGAAWHYVLWGLYHGLGLAVCSFYRRVSVLRPVAALMDRLPGLAWLVTFIYVCLGWLVFFYAPDDAWNIFLSLWRV